MGNSLNEYLTQVRGRLERANDNCPKACDDLLEHDLAKLLKLVEIQATALETAHRMLDKIYENAKVNADTYDREWVAAHPGLDHGFCANMWRSAEQHILMCRAGFRVKANEIVKAAEKVVGG